MDRNTGKKTQWVLGFDGGCSTCGRLAQELVALSDGKLTAKSLRSAEVQGWREQALGVKAPWAPTLFAVEGESVRAWTGKGLVARLGRLVGPHKLWRIAMLVGGLMEPLEEPASRGRRVVLRRGIIGTAASLALLNGGVGTRGLAALAQGLAEDRVSSAANTQKSRYAVEKLDNNRFNDMERRAKNDRSFQIIREYFTHEHSGRGWGAKGRDGLRLTRDGDRVRDVFAITFVKPGDDEWSHVIYAEEDGGKRGSHVYLWKGKDNRFPDRFYTQNGNLRRDDLGRVDRQDVGAADFLGLSRCDWYAIGCTGVTGGSCVGMAVATAAGCPASIGTACVPMAGATMTCGLAFSSENEGCQENAGC